MIPADIGQLIRQARKAKGITQEQLAAMMFVSRQTASHRENSRTQPDYDTRNRLALLLDINLAEAFAPAKHCRVHLFCPQKARLIRLSKSGG